MEKIDSASLPTTKRQESIDAIVNSLEKRDSPGYFFSLLHGYQPPRKIRMPTGNLTELLPEKNEEIFQECYQKLFVEGAAIKPGVVFSLYPSLRSWIKVNHPGDWEKIKTNIAGLLNKDYQILGDSLIHAILPLLSRTDQDILVKAGRRAYEKDFGFSPKGIWLPEAAVSDKTLSLLTDNGYEFVVLGKDQLVNLPEAAGPGKPVDIFLSDGKKITVFYFDKETSGTIAFHPEETNTVEQFLNEQRKKGNDIDFGCDAETFGHHQKNGKDIFFDLLTDPEVLEAAGLQALNPAKFFGKDKTRSKAKVKKNSSWSCPHDLARWMGSCGCAGGDCAAVSEEKKAAFINLYSHNQRINKQIKSVFDSFYPDINWQEELINLLVEYKDEIFTGGDFIERIKTQVENPLLQNLYAQKIYALLGVTSCGWFHQDATGQERVERQIPQKCLETIRCLQKELRLGEGKA